LFHLGSDLFVPFLGTRECVKRKCVQKGSDPDRTNARTTFFKKLGMAQFKHSAIVEFCFGIKWWLKRANFGIQTKRLS